MLFHRLFARASYPELAATLHRLFHQLNLPAEDWHLLTHQPATYRQPYRYEGQGSFVGVPFLCSLYRSPLGEAVVEERLELVLTCDNPHWQRWILAPAITFEVAAKRCLDVQPLPITTELPIVLGANQPEAALTMEPVLARYSALWTLLGDATITLERERLCAQLPWVPDTHARETALLTLFEFLDQLRNCAAHLEDLAQH